MTQGTGAGRGIRGHAELVDEDRSAPYSGTACRLGSPGARASLSYGLGGLGATYLFHAIRKASVGRRGLSPPLAEHNLDAYLAKAQEASVYASDTLTSHERHSRHKR
jgi:hypothetical protein